MSNFQEKLNTEWVECVEILSTVEVNLSSTTSIKEITEKLSDIEIVENAIYDDDFQTCFKDEEEVKEYSINNKETLVAEFGENKVDYFINHYSADYEGYNYIENINHKYDRKEITGSQVKQIKEFKLFIEDLHKKEELANQLNETLSTKVEKKKSIKI